MRVRVSLASRKNLEFGELERFGDIGNPNLAISVLPGAVRARVHSSSKLLLLFLTNPHLCII